MLHMHIWYVNIIEIRKGIGNGKKISICRIFGIEKSFFEFQIVFGKHKGMFYIALGDKTCLAFLM